MSVLPSGQELLTWRMLDLPSRLLHLVLRLTKYIAAISQGLPGKLQL